MAVFTPIKGAKISSNTHHHPFYKTSAEWECNLIETNCSGLKEQACSLHILYQHSEQTGTFFYEEEIAFEVLSIFIISWALSNPGCGVILMVHRDWLCGGGKIGLSQIQK